MSYHVFGDNGPELPTRAPGTGEFAYVIAVSTHELSDTWRTSNPVLWLDLAYTRNVADVTVPSRRTRRAADTTE